ncbi:uncharacterized protein K452DRAFT_15925 [Aplosporella prunicola CBS 121167]|uniref:Uncharacterized protein n=1 Tax=Aplosporella prunicola CBS 121167 TaxID=1176127 RepID=A0A6A6AX73_9PEZI|nr:uncharacterized protein K452DRAFT_15925 [Aplosporella prunicola CBS 121167]KAF2135524.1 hypothetical protein K452DRAFT_15925 [Aplosporella prunicola CBS 121167]
MLRPVIPPSALLLYLLAHRYCLPWWVGPCTRFARWARARKFFDIGRNRMPPTHSIRITGRATTYEKVVEDVGG